MVQLYSNDQDYHNNIGNVFSEIRKKVEALDR
jgi:hypothetical protein